MIALVLQSTPKKDFAIAKVREGAARGQMPRLLKEFECMILDPYSDYVGVNISFNNFSSLSFPNV